MDTNRPYKVAIVIIVIIGFIAVLLSMNHAKKNITKAEISYITKLEQVDSLKSVIDSLQTEIFFLEDECDYKEHRYEDIIGEYEIGLSYLKDYHLIAYKDFHRIIGMREKYSRELDKENKKRLKIK